jgi:hypothetical protein
MRNNISSDGFLSWPRKHSATIYLRYDLVRHDNSNAKLICHALKNAEEFGQRHLTS